MTRMTMYINGYLSMTDDPRHGRLGIWTEYNSGSSMKTPQILRALIRLARVDRIFIL